jgi:hypothetical protein
MKGKGFMNFLEKVFQDSDNIRIRKILDFLKPFAGLKGWSLTRDFFLTRGFLRHRNRAWEDHGV